MPSSWPVSNGGYLAQLSIEYCYVATISGFSGLEAVGPPAPHNTQKVGKTKLRNVGREVIDTRTGGGDCRIAPTPYRRADRLLHCRCQQAGSPHVATLVLRHNSAPILGDPHLQNASRLRGEQHLHDALCTSAGDLPAALVAELPTQPEGEWTLRVKMAPPLQFARRQAPRKNDPLIHHAIRRRNHSRHDLRCNVAHPQPWAAHPPPDLQRRHIRSALPRLFLFRIHWLLPLRVRCLLESGAAPGANTAHGKRPLRVRV